jgi:cell wall-associated NlpC family hydrolase
MPDALHWSAALIGRPYAEHARGPQAFNCWGLLQWCWRERLGLAVPDVREDAGAAFRSIMRDGRYAIDDIEAVEVPLRDARECDAIFMTSRQQPHHCGLWIAPGPRGGVLHAIEGAGVVFQRRPDLAAHGFSIVRALRLKRVS